jgi:hypothetical protein
VSGQNESGHFGGFLFVRGCVDGVMALVGWDFKDQEEGKKELTHNSHEC